MSHFKVSQHSFYVIGKMLSGELSCTGLRFLHCMLSCLICQLPYINTSQSDKYSFENNYSELSFQIVPDRAGFHTSNSIFPVGYCSTRVYASLQNPDKQCLYTCKISDGGTGPAVNIIYYMHNKEK